MVSVQAQIQDVERYFGVRFPEDYRQFLLAHGSLGQFLPPFGDYLAIHPVHEIIAENEAGEIQERFPAAVVIGGDGSRELLAYDFRHDPSPLVHLDITAEDWTDALYQAPSLTTMLEQFPESGWSWDASRTD